MFTTLKKIWRDTTTNEGRYVAKDVMKMAAFLVGLLALVAALVAPCFGVNIGTEVGLILLSFALGGQAFKSHYQYKNNAVASDCPAAAAPTGDYDSGPVPKTAD